MLPGFVSAYQPLRLLNTWAASCLDSPDRLDLTQFLSFNFAPMGQILRQRGSYLDLLSLEMLVSLV